MQRATTAILLLGIAGLLACTREAEAPHQGALSQETRSASSADQKLQVIRADIQALKTELGQAGEYSCCIQEGCSMCLLHEGACPCKHELEGGRHVCVECYAGWQQGKGAVQGISKEAVTTSFVKHEHKH